jgi:uncharacterized protein
MKIIIAGGSGFLGKALENYFTERHHEVWILTRNSTRNNEIQWDARTIGAWTDCLENAEVLINLTGKSVDCRYNDANKAEILRSRIDSTKVLQEATNLCKNPPKIWLNSSSATIYIHAETQLMTEAEGIIGDDFSMNICKAWERVFFEKTTPKTRKVALRTSIVLGNGGGAFPKLKMVTRMGLGGTQGIGNQKVSWIHVEDFCRAIHFIIQDENIVGEINITSPQPIENKEFMKLIRNTMNIPFGINSPRFLLELASVFLQTETELLLKSRNVYPQRLLDLDFEFEHKTAEEAVKDLCGK